MSQNKKAHARYMREWRKKNPERNKQLEIESNKKRREYFAKWFQKNKERYRESRKEYYLKHKEYFKRKSQEHYLANKERILSKAREFRKQVVMAYGGKCVCCGETKIEFLALDHKNNDGAKFRKEICASKTYRWAKENNYPDTLQVLCHNCNLAKAFYGRCPHDRTKS